MLGERLQELRKERGLSQKTLGELLSVSQFTVSSYECNHSNPDDETKVKLARLFNVSLDYLMGLIREPLPFIRDSNCIKLPDDFQPEDIKKLQSYIAFLQYEKSHL